MFSTKTWTYFSTCSTTQGSRSWSGTLWRDCPFLSNLRKRWRKLMTFSMSWSTLDFTRSCTCWKWCWSWMKNGGSSWQGPSRFHNFWPISSKFLLRPKSKKTTSLPSLESSTPWLKFPKNTQKWLSLIKYSTISFQFWSISLQWSRRRGPKT